MTVSTRTRKVFRWIGWGLAGLAAFLPLAAIFYVLVVLPRLESSAHDFPPFASNKKMAIEKRLPNGTVYTVNNSTATFRLDVVKPDAHCQLVFTNYAAALAYCQERGLPTLPSVQLIQGKLKQFDDQLCAALELAMEERRAQALTRLLKALSREANEEATLYVATALALAGAEPDVSGEMKRRVEAERSAFLETPEARPCGFWDGSERLRRNFQSDRYLMRGLSVHDSPEACLALSRAIMGDEALREAFRQLQAFGAALTNPGRSVSAETLAGLSPQEAASRFAHGERFALVSYSGSKEQALLERLNREISPDVSLMPLMIDAVRSGRLKLEPKPGSGWYDYQWYALETLLAPERGRESAKLRLTDAYKKRLESAFATALAKTRETHIKRLPVLTLGSDGGPDEPPPKVKVAPEFAAEPTLTVYLRLGRAYRFLRQALAATMGEEELARVLVAPSQSSASSALQESAKLCYGLYERLCLEIGRVPDYLPDELTAEERAEAQGVFGRWHDTWNCDSALASDVRAVAPVIRWPGGRTRYWAAAGVRLERAVYTYLDKPEVGGEVEAEFAPCAVYLPTDLFLEFERSTPAPLARDEFLALCDGCRNATALRHALGVTQPSKERAPSLNVGRWARCCWGWAAAALVGLVFWRLRRARRLIVLISVGVVVVWGFLTYVSPVNRTLFLVRHVATVNAPLGIACEYSWVKDISLAPRLKGLAILMQDPDPQVRYLAARYMAGGKDPLSSAETNAWFQAGIKKGILWAAKDPDPEIASLAVCCLDLYHDPDVADTLLEMLSTRQAHDELCFCILATLGELRDPRAIQPILPLCEDTRAVICLAAIEALGQFPQAEAQEHLWRLSESRNRVVRNIAAATIKKSCPAWWGPALNKEQSEARCEGLFVERVMNSTLPFEVRLTHAYRISGEKLSLEASARLVEDAKSTLQTNEVLTCLARGFLKRHGQIYPDGASYLGGIISNTTASVELARAAQAKSPDAVKQALIAILCTATNNPHSGAGWFAIQALDNLQDSSSPLEKKRRRKK